VSILSMKNEKRNENSLVRARFGFDVLAVIQCSPTDLLLLSVPCLKWNHPIATRMGTVLLVDGSLVVPMDIVGFGPPVFDTLRQL
jgi:hypothetical protein